MQKLCVFKSYYPIKSEEALRRFLLPPGLKANKTQDPVELLIQTKGLTQSLSHLNEPKLEGWRRKVTQAGESRLSQVLQPQW